MNTFSSRSATTINFGFRSHYPIPVPRRTVTVDVYLVRTQISLPKGEISGATHLTKQEKPVFLCNVGLVGAIERQGEILK